MPAQNKKKDHLPVLGVGPAYVIVITVLTVACIALSKLGFLPYLRIRATVGVMHTVGTAFLIVGIWLWVSAAIKEKLREKIIANQLVTTGVYALVRNPIYSAFAFVMSGAALLSSNLYLLPLPLVFWVLLTVMMQATEEKWLLEQFGDEYREYCKRVNRCIPWFPKR